MPYFQAVTHGIRPNPNVSDSIFFNPLVHVLVHVGAWRNPNIFRRRSFS